MPRVNFGADAELRLEAEQRFGLEIRVGVGLGPSTLVFRPGPDQVPLSLARVTGALGTLLGIEALENLAKVGGDGIWKKVFDVSVLPELTVVLAAETSSIQARFMLYTRESRDERYYGLRISDYLPSFVTIEPDITIYDLIVGYWKADGLDLRARIAIWPQTSEVLLADGDVVRLRDDRPAKTEIVKYPFPTPDQGGPLFRVNYLGLGQRFGPPTSLNGIATIFEELEHELRSNDPAVVLNELAQKYYHPDRNWFFGVDLDVKGWRVQAIFNDPTMYGVRITCATPTFEGFEFEILYQKLGPDLGVFYGSISVPEKFRSINLGAVALKLPSFEIWIYTNGDFRIAVGWPLGPKSIGFEISIFIGGCAFYLAKLRTGFNPRAPAPEIYYNPIVAFGLAVKVGLGRTLNAGPLHGELSLTLQGVFQGILAWEGDSPARLASPDDQVRLAAREAAAGRTITRAPDYFWFAATVGVVGVLQGEVDLKILKVSVVIQLSVTAGLAFETGFASSVRITASVKAEASVKVLFVRISVSFSTTVTETFHLSSGTGEASVDGPQNPNFQGIVPERARLRHRDIVRYGVSSLSVDPEPAQLAVHLVLLPAAIYRGGTAQSSYVAVPMIAPPRPEGDAEYNVLLERYGAWLLREWAPKTQSWSEVLVALGQGRDAAPDDFQQKLASFVAAELRFVLGGVDLSSSDPAELHLLPLPMLPPLAMTMEGRPPVVFAENRVPSGYDEVVRRYFDDLSLSGAEASPGDQPLAEDAAAQSFAEMIFTEYFLLLGRDMARRLAEPPVGEAGLLGELKEDIRGIAEQVAGMATRTLIGGILLPDPNALAAFALGTREVDLVGLYELSWQLVSATLDVPVNAVTFTLHDPDSPWAPAIAFVDGDSAVSKIPVAAPPPAPHPIWHGEQLRSEIAEISISPLPPVTTVRRWFGCREHEAWDDLGSPRRLMLPPPELMALAADGPLTLLAQTTEPEPKVPPQPDLSLVPALLLQLRIRQVSEQLSAQVSDSGAVLPAVVKGVYAISATDEATRDRLGELLGSTELSATQIELLRIGADGGYSTLPARASDARVFLFKTNLSILTQPEMLSREVSLTAEDIDAAPITDTAGFLRLIWQASVVNASGFFLSYADPDDAPLPEELFGENGTATLVVLARASAPRALRGHDNSLVLPGDAKNTVFIAANTADGAPVVNHQTSYPAGCIGFRIDWRNGSSLRVNETERPAPYDPDTIAALYDQIQFRIVGSDTPGGLSSSLWSLPLSRAKDDSLGDDDGGPGTYRQVVPVYRFVPGGDADIYAAVGKTSELEFRLLDAFGNALADASHRARFAVLYRDPLVPLGEWPGTRATYRVDTDGSGAPVLSLVLDFQPSEVVRADVHEFLVLAPGHDDKARQQAEVARSRYELIVAQLRDSNVEAQVLSTFFGPLAPLSEGDGVKRALGAFAATVLAGLERFLVDGTPLVEQHAKLAVPFVAGRLTEQPDTIFPICIEVELARRSFVDPEAVASLPSVGEVRWRVPPDLDERGGEVDLRQFAKGLEDAFAGFDQDKGALKLALRNGTSDLADTEGEPVLWGLKLSRSHGLAVTFDPDAASYFALAPISTKLESHAGVEVTTWDAELSPRTESRAFSGIDVDGWARTFLRAVDTLLSPGPANAITRAAPDRFRQLGIAKRLLAECIKAGVEPVLLPAPAGDGARRFGPRAVVEGDRESARDRFEQLVLTRLSAAYDSVVVVQVPAHVSNSQTALVPARAPRLFGGVTTTRLAHGDGEGARDAVSVSNLRLPTVSSSEEGVCAANVLVTAVSPSEQASIDLSLTWQARYIEHRIAESSTTAGYASSSWLRVIDTDTDAGTATHGAARLSFTLGPVRVPLPAIRYPAAPVLVAHGVSGEGSTGWTRRDIESSESPFLWGYEATLRKPDRDARDTLVAELHLNEPVTSDGPVRRVRGPGEKGDVIPLFEALARFTVAWPELERLVVALTRGELPADKADALIGIVEELVREVAISWAAYRGVPIPEVWAELVLDRVRQGGAPPVAQTWRFEIDFERAYRSKPELVVRCSDKDVVWPTINGVRGNDGAGSERTYSYDDRGEELTLSWPGLHALSAQTARLHASIVRNSNLGTPGANITNPDFVYRTPPTTFASPVIPHLRVARYDARGAYDTLAEALYRTLGGLLDVGSAGSTERWARIETRYEYALIRDPRRRESAVRVQAPVLLSDGIEISLAGAQGDPILELAESIARDIELWREAESLPTDGGELVQTLTLFTVIQGVHQPILTIDRIVYAVPENWWGATPGA